MRRTTTCSNALSSALYEVQEYLVPTRHMTPSMDLTMNKDKFYSMPQSYQDLLICEICEDMSAYDYDVCHCNGSNTIMMQSGPGTWNAGL